MKKALQGETLASIGKEMGFLCFQVPAKRDRSDLIIWQLACGKYSQKESRIV
jgi:hypothetical protein